MSAKKNYMYEHIYCQKNIALKNNFLKISCSKILFFFLSYENII